MFEKDLQTSMVIVHADGRCADRYEENRREIQSALVQICSENKLTIPFNRLTINLAGDGQKPLLSASKNKPTENSD
ncbi:MAG: hypothetical protein QF687_00350 [Nitrospinaceae bacterium]|jgi:small-conductance mechanosensitive channel|nr:hypothetical protein [Nitrospinaceae bacterium]MDP7556318.1 hypothetical protein [Nitrospinaceae bacterium]|tara:strand:+ start:2205 stop:2432 length:228 start_codon:yes stop_codon:yes gene_type:complete